MPVPYPYQHLYILLITLVSVSIPVSVLISIYSNCIVLCTVYALTASSSVELVHATSVTSLLTPLLCSSCANALHSVLCQLRELAIVGWRILANC